MLSAAPPPPDMDSVGESLDTLSGFLSLRSTIATPLDSKAVREITVTVTTLLHQS